MRTWRRIGVLIFSIGIMATGTHAQKSIDRFIDRQLKHKNAIAMSLPGWFVRSGANFAKRFADDDDGREFLKLAKYIRKLRFIVIDGHLRTPDDEIGEVLYKARAEDFEEYANVRSAADHVHIMVKEQADVIRGIFVLVYTTESLVAVHIKSKLPVEIFDQMDFGVSYEDMADGVE